MNSLLQKGFSIIELMIALLLGSILLLGVTQMLISSSTLGTTSNNLSVNQDKAKTVIDLLGSEIGRAGYQGCTRTVDTRLDISGGDQKRTYPFVPLADPLGVMFAYGVDETTADGIGTTLISRDCFGNTLRYRGMAYQNCGNNLCIRGYSDITSNTADLIDDIIEDVQIVGIVITLRRGEKPIEYRYSVASLPTTENIYNDNLDSDVKKMVDAKLVTFVIRVTTAAAGAGDDKYNAETTVVRNYSATFRLRNL